MNNNLSIAMKKIMPTLMTVMLIMLCSVTLLAQDVMITGVVKDNTSGLGMPGVSVAVKGTSTGMITDIDGKYSLNVPTGAILVFSFIGYETTEVTITNNTVVNVSLKESVQSLDEVVVLGYGTTTKKEVTGAVTSIKSKDFNPGTFNDPMGLIQGKVAGLSITKPDGADPLAGYQILLRGANTLTSGQSPLIIIDGVIGADLKNINFQDVESFDVLKDGSAAAIYGTRGTNGVIIITTKQARKGKGTFEYSAQLSTQMAPRGVDNLSASEYEYAVKNYTSLDQDEVLKGANTNWFNEITRDAPVSYQQNVALSGGTDNFSHRTSLTHSTAQGLLDGNESKRLLLKTNLQQHVLNDKLKLDFNLTNNIRTYNPANYDIFRQAFIQNPTQPVYDNSDPKTGGYSYDDELEYYNPVAMINERQRDGKTNDMILNLRATVKILNNLSWDNFISTQRSEWEDNSYKTQFYPSLVGTDDTPGLAGEAEIANGRSMNSQFESVINYGTSFGAHNLDVVAGYSFQEFENNSSYVGNSNFDTDVYGYNNIGAGSALVNGKAFMGSGKSSSRLIALFARTMYNINERYLASVSIRREGSSKFGDNHKWGWFPAVSLGWQIHEEGFLNDVSWVNQMKLRVGYGVTGNQDFDPYQSLILLTRSGGLYYNQQWINAYEPSQNPNPDLRWEKKKELNIGVDFGLFKSRLSGSIEYYFRRTEDLLWTFEVSVPPYLDKELFTNVGTIDNQGVELTLNALVMKKGSFQWSSTLTASHNQNILKELSNDEFTQKSYPTGFLGGAITVYTQKVEEGKPLGTFYGPVWLGVKDGADVFKNQNPVGEVDESDWEDIGNANPLAILGWSNNLSYKNWNLTLAFRAGIGGKVLNSYRLYYESWSSLSIRNIVHTQYENPEFAGDITYSSKYVEDASFLKLDNVTLTYNFNFDSKYISRLSVFGSAQNVFWITGYKGIDPEVNRGGLEPGIDRLSYYPRTTSLTLGLNATF
jgi:TonB-linked SusC/RagA family outer membrane protein